MKTAVSYMDVIWTDACRLYENSQILTSSGDCAELAVLSNWKYEEHTVLELTVVHTVS